MTPNEDAFAAPPDKGKAPHRRHGWLTVLVRVGLGLALLASLTANVVLYRQMREYYEARRCPHGPGG